MKEKNRTLLAALTFGAIGALWRRWYGGGFGKAGKITRFFKYLALIIVCLTMMYVKTLCFTFLGDFTTYEQIASFAYHWARSHGDYFYVWSEGKDEGRIRWIDFTLRLIYGKDGYYNFKGNVTGLFLRYTSTACVVAFFLHNPLFILSGLLTTLSYVATSKMEKPTAKAEWLAGALNFILFFVCL
ncbi:MAG: hypothetical protein J5781_00115 [Clostridia bacterium]|nr:hypothetical protein [Clostridia bacterium]